MKKFTFLLIGFAAIVTMLTYGFNFPFAENSTGLNTVSSETPFNFQSPRLISPYTWSQPAGTYTTITGGAGTVVITAVGVDDNVYTSMPIGFTSNFDGVAYTTFGLNANGWICMGGASVTSSYTPISSGTTRNVISAMGQDLLGQATGKIEYQTSGTAPNRVLTVQWSNWAFYSGGVVDGSTLNWQIKLFETTDNIQIIYGANTSSATSHTVQVGLGGAATTDFNNRLTTTNWSATTAGTLNSDACTVSTTVVPATNLTFQWAPPPASPMTYVSSTTAQVTPGLNITQSSLNNPIIQVQVVTTGTLSPFNLTSLNLNTSGSTNPADFVNAKVYYTGTTNTFSTGTLFGTTTSPSGAFTVSGSQALSTGTNYFWLTYDATAGAVIGDSVDAQSVTIVGSGSMGTQTPTVTNPAGKRQIDNYCRGTFTNNGCLGTGIYITNVSLGSINNTSTCDPDVTFPYNYSWFVNQSATLEQGVTYPISATTFSSSNAQGFAVWVDWDNNGLFDANEYTAFPVVSGGVLTSSTFITVPPGATLGNHRMRVRNNLSTSPTSAQSCTVLSYGETEDYTVNVTVAVPMVYTSCTTTQNNTTAFTTPSLNTEVIGVQVVTNGSLSPLNATSFTFNTNGSTNPVTDLTNAKLWYTGMNTTFATTSLYGVPFVSPNGTFTVSGSKVLLPGTNYFWLTYDVPLTATGGDFVDAECTSILIGTPRTPTITAPAGNRLISNSKMSGIYTIPGNYPNFTTAITDLNNRGIYGPVTFNVSSGFSDTAVNLTINTTGTAANPIIFQRVGANAKLLPNPVIYAGVGTSTTTDGIIKFNGTDYITFDGIDLMENPANVTPTTQTEWGYAFVKPNGTDGCQNNTIKNCTITLNKTNLPTVGIYSGNHLATSTTSFTVTTTAGTSSNNTFFNNTITNSYVGIYIAGFAAAAPYDFYDQNNTINQNTITNYGGGANTAYAIYNIYQNGLAITNCTLNSSGGTNSTATLYGIFCSTMINSNLTITGNNVTIVSGSTTSSIYGINFGNASAGTTNTVNVSNNTILNSTYLTATSGAMYAIYCNAITSTLNVTGNRIIGNTYGTAATSTGIYYGIYSVSAAINNINITNNLDSGNTVLGTTAYSAYRIYNAGATFNVAITGNKIKNNTFGGTTATGTSYGIYNTQGTFTCNLSNNTVSDNIFPTTSSQSMYFIYTTSVAPTFDCSANTISNNTGTGTGTFYGIYFSASPVAGSTENITNNNVTNLSKTTATGTGTIYGIYHGGSGQGTINLNNNNITGFSSAAATGFYGIYQIGSPPNYVNINNNKVGNFTNAGVSTIYGIYNNPSATSYVTISQDSVYNITSAGSTIYGMYNVNGAGVNISRNTIAGLTSNTSTTAIVYGLYIGGGVTTNVYNNFISDLNTPASTSTTPAISGLYIGGSTYVNAYYNTIFLKAVSTSVTTFSTAGIYASTTPIVDLRNNVVVNNSTPGAGGQAVAYRRSSNLLTSYFANSNNNCFYAGAPSATNLIFYDGINSDQTLAAYKIRVNPKDNASGSENPPFVNSTTAPYDLRVQTGIATILESGGQVIATPVNITNDYFTTARYPNSGYPVGGFTPIAPDMGAHEFGGLNSGSAGPIISYSALGTGGTSNRAFNNVIITDPNGINTTAGTKPRCYYKRSTDGNVINDNTSGTDGWKYVEANGTTSPFDFTINYTLLNGGTGVVGGQSVQYFVIAQDLSGTPVVSWNTAAFTTAPTTVALIAGNAPITLTGSYLIGTNTFSGIYNVGTAQTYTSLTGAAGIFASINAGTVTGDITISITSDMTEDGTNALNALNETGVGGYKVRVVPASASIKTISGTVAQGMIRLSGANRVTFDGDNGLGAKYLTFRNTNGANPTFVFLNEASNDSLKNCTFESNNASVVTTTAGTILFSTTTGLQGNDNNVIATCDIRDRSDATGYPAFGIYCNGTTTTIPQYNSNNTITGNNVYNYFLDAASFTGGVFLNAGSTDWIITGNSLYQTTPKTVTLGATFNGIYNNIATNNNNNQITNNYIGGSAPLCGGTPMTYSGVGAYTFNGIQAYVSVLSPTNITGNTIKNINLSTSPASGNSLFFKAIYAQTGWINVNNNIIGAPTGNDNIILTTNTTISSYIISIISHLGFGSVNGNTMGSITFNGTSTGTADSYYGINYSNTTAGFTYSINNNLLGSLTTPNSIQQTKTVTGTGMRGILMANGVGTINNITNNTIANWTDFSTSTLNTASVYGFSNAGAGNYNMSGNTVRNLTNYCNVPSASFLLGGIFNTGAGINTYTQNNIYSLYALGTGAGCQLVGGILAGGTTGGTVSRNKIFDFRHLGTGVLAPAPLLLGFNVQSSGPYTLSNNNVSLTNGDPTDAKTQELMKEVRNTSYKVDVPEVKQTSPIGLKDKEGYASDQINMEKPIVAELYGFNDKNSDQSNELKKGSVKDGPLSTANCSIAGVYHTSSSPGATNYYFNSFYIGGNQPSGAYSSWTFVRTSAGAVSFKNNLFVNARTGGAGNQYVIGNEGANPLTGWNTTASDYNAFIGPNANTIGEWGLGNAQSFAQWQLTTGGDMNSSSDISANIPGATLFRNISTGDLNIDTTQYGAAYVYKKGIGIAGITTDYNGYPRATSGPVNIGSHEFTLSKNTAVTLLIPSNNAVDVVRPVNMVWSKALYATGYRIQIATDDLFNNIVVETNVTDSTYLFSTALPITYWWRVNPRYTSINGTFSTVFKFTAAAIAPNVPVLALPVNGATGQPQTITFQWYKAIESLSSTFKKDIKESKNESDNPKAISKYWFEYGTDPTLATVIARDSSLTDTTKVVSGLNPITQYYWRVKAKNQIGWGGFSAIWNFTTALPIPSAPTLLLPANNAVDLSITPTLDWNDVTYATSYRVQISTSNTFGTTVYDTVGLTVSTIVVPAGKLTTNTLYYWRVNATNANGTSAYSTVWAFTTAPNAPNGTILALPVNGATGQPTTVTFKWYKAIETLIDNQQKGKSDKESDDPKTISKYLFEYGTDPTLATVLARDSSLTDTTKILSGLATGTTYYWRVKAKNQTGWGAFSSIWNFATLTPTLSLNLKVYMEGFWDGAAQVSDTVRVYLANATTPYAYVDTAKVVLNATGQASMNFNRVTTGSYYIVVNHRNHLETWSKLPQSFVGGTPLSYDFTTAMTQAFGDNMKQVGSVWVLFGGDANRDGSIDAGDIGIFVVEFGTLGYLSSDFNGDQDVNAADVTIIANNFGLIKITPGGEPLSPEVLKNKKLQLDKAVKNSMDKKQKNNK